MSAPSCMEAGVNVAPPPHAFTLPIALSVLYINLFCLFFLPSCHPSFRSPLLTCIISIVSYCFSFLHCSHPSETCCCQTYLSKVYTFGDKISLLKTLSGTAYLLPDALKPYPELRSCLIKALWPRGSPKTCAPHL